MAVAGGIPSHGMLWWRPVRRLIGHTAVQADTAPRVFLAQALASVRFWPIADSWMREACKISHTRY